MSAADEGKRCGPLLCRGRRRKCRRDDLQVVEQYFPEPMQRESQPKRAVDCDFSDEFEGFPAASFFPAGF